MNPRPIRVHAPPDAIVQFTIYRHPKDFPEGYVVRAWAILPGCEPVPHSVGWCCPTLEDARSLVPPDKVCLTRHPDDDPAIAEVWT